MDERSVFMMCGILTFKHSLQLKYKKYRLFIQFSRVYRIDIQRHCGASPIFVQISGHDIRVTPLATPYRVTATARLHWLLCQRSLYHTSFMSSLWRYCFTVPEAAHRELGYNGGCHLDQGVRAWSREPTECKLQVLTTRQAVKASKSAIASPGYNATWYVHASPQKRHKQTFL